MINGKIDWAKYFDAIWCIDYKPHKLRKQLILKQFDRVGILNHPNFKFHETFPSPYDEYMYKNLAMDNKVFMQQAKTCVSVMNASFGHYACIKKSLLDNNQRVLILQNDIRFLKNLEQIQNILINIPNDADIILFDYFIACQANEFQTYKSQCFNNYFYHYKNLASTGCYMLSNKALMLFQKQYENMIVAPDIYLAKFDNQLNKYFTLKNMACQVTYSKCMNVTVSSMNILHYTYLKSNLNYNDYNMNDGKQYKFGDFIIENE